MVLGFLELEHESEYEFHHDDFEVPEWEEIASEGKKVESVPCVPIFDTGERHAKDLFQKGMISRKDVLGALKLASLKTRINNRTVAVSGQSAPKKLDTWVFGLYNRGGVVGITNDTKRRPWLSRLVTAMIRAERPGFEFSAFSINQNLEIGMHRDTTNLKGSMNAVIGLNKFSGGQLWVEDPKGSIEKAIPVDKLTKDGPTKVLGRLIVTSEKAVTFDGRKWHCAEPTRDERLTIACYTPCGIRQTTKGTRRILKRLGFVLPRRHGTLLGSTPGIRTAPAMPCVETSVQEHNEKIAKEEEEILDAILSRLALVSRPVGRKEMLSNPKAIEATKKEWAGLNKRCWEFKSMREKDDVAKEARETGEEIHFARAHTIMVEKHHILDEDDPRRKFKARGVCLGNQMTDQSNEAAVFSDLGSSPASFEASRWADFYGSLKGNSCQTADAIQAYLQALLLGRKCWMELPPEAIPDEYKKLYNSFRRPVVLCTHAIYGHPDAGTSWEVYCDEAVKKQGFEPMGENWPSVYFHRRLKLLLVIYVDDLKMAGPTQNLKEGWSLLRQAIEIEPEVDSGLYLGCEIHYGSEKMSDGHEVRTVTYDMTKFLSDCVSKYRDCAGYEGDFPKVPTPNLVENTREHKARSPNLETKDGVCFCSWCKAPCFKDDEQVDAVGSMYVSDVKQHSETSNFPDADATSLLGHSRGSKPEVGESAVPQGKLAKHAAGVLMKILYAARIARFDLLRTVNRLARRIMKWTEEDDAALFRLISFIQHSKEDKMIGWVGDDMSSLHLALYADADFAGCVESLRSTSGAHLNLQGPHTRFPLAGLSKQQGCVSHSTPEAEIVSADTAVRTIGLPALDLWDILSSTKGNLCLYEDNQAMISVVRSGRNPTMRYLERTHGVSVAWLHEIFQADHIALVYEITGKMAADIYTKGYDDARKWKSVTSLINIVTPEFLRSPQALELSRSTNDLSCKRLLSVSEDGIPYFTHTQTPILPPELYVAGGSGKPGWHDHEKGRFLVIKEPKMMRTAEPGLLRSSWFLKGGHWTKIEDHVDPSDKNTRRLIPEYIERGVFQFHTRHVALPAGSRQTISSVPFSDGLLSLKRAVCRGYGSSVVGRCDLPPSVVDQLDALQHVAVGGVGPGCDLVDIGAFLWDHVLFKCTLDDPVEAIDAYNSLWSHLKPESQLDFYGDVQLDFLNHQHVRLTTYIIPGKCIDAEQLSEIASPGRSTGIKISFVEVDESLPRLFVLGGRNLHGVPHGEEWGTPRVCLISIPSMRVEGQSLEPVNNEAEYKKLADNFRTDTDAVLFSGCEAVNVDCHGRSSELKVWTSFWSLWKMFCDFLFEIEQDVEHRAVAILPNDQNILGDVRMGGFKHQFQLLSSSCAFGIAMPDGRMLSEKMVLRSQKVRVQDFHTNSCEGHVHTGHCGVRRIAYTGLGEIIQNIAWELDVLKVIAGNDYSEENEPKKCACAVGLRLISWQPRHSSPASPRKFDCIGAEVHPGQPQITCVDRVMQRLDGLSSHVGEDLCHGRHCHVSEGSYLQGDIDPIDTSQAYGCVVASGFTPGPNPMATSSTMTTGNDPSVFEVKKGKDGPECSNFIRMVNNRSPHSPIYKISREMFQIPHKMTDINKLSAALKQLCMYLKYHELQGQKQMISGDYTDLPDWVNYWIRSGVSPLILLAACVFASRKGDPTLSDPNFIHTTIDSLRSMYDGTWGRIAVDSSLLGGSVVEFVAKCNRFMTAWCTKAMGGEGSSDNSKIIGENNLLTECMFNMQVDEMKGFTLEWVRIFWNRFGEVIRDPVLGPSSSTTLAQFLDRNQPITRGMLSNIIFDRCRETCWYIVQGHISPVDAMMLRLSGSQTTFDQLRPRLAVWMHFRDALRRCGRILGTAMRMKEYSLKDVILILVVTKNAEILTLQIKCAWRMVMQSFTAFIFLMGMALRK